MPSSQEAAGRRLVSPHAPELVLEELREHVRAGDLTLLVGHELVEQLSTAATGSVGQRSGDLPRCSYAADVGDEEQVLAARATRTVDRSVVEVGVVSRVKLGAQISRARRSLAALKAMTSVRGEH